MQKISKAHIWSLFIYLCFVSMTALGEPHIYANKLNSCGLTKPETNDYEPLNFQRTNNLLRTTGAQTIICGKKIIITGRVLDESCVPVSDAKVYLWQVGCDGKYPYEALRKSVDRKLLNLSNGSSFTGSGIATTNNNGEFVFVTILPTALKDNLPYVNIRVEHKMLNKLQTKLYINSDAIINLDAKDSITSLYNDTTQIYEFDIVMSGRTFKRY